MATLTIRNIDENLKTRLRVEAALHGHSMEEEVRFILRQVLITRQNKRGLGQRIHKRFSELGGVDLALPARKDKPRAPDLSK